MTAITSNIITQEEALELIESIVSQSEAEGVFVSLSSSESALSRFSENQISQNISKNNFNITIASYFGKRTASASTTELNREAIADTLRRSEDLARFAPEDPEWVELLSPQDYADREPAFDLATAEISPIAKGEIIEKVCSDSKKAGVSGSGTLSTSTSLRAIGNSIGLRGCDRGTDADFSLTTKQDNGSSWGRISGWGMEQLPIEETTAKVIDRTILSKNPQEIEPGKYRVILEPQALGSLLPWVAWNMGARSADEGRSFMSRINEKGEPIGNRVGEKIFSDLVQISRDPNHPLLRSGRFFGDGLPNSYLELVKDGIPQTLSYSRYWGRQQGKQPTGDIYPIVMAGGEKSINDLIEQTERGILVTRCWYVRYINPRNLEVTGMTRDGTFLIENGTISYPIKNLRFNQSLPKMLKDVVSLAKAQRFGSSVIPGLSIDNFNFSSVTDSI